MRHKMLNACFSRSVVYSRTFYIFKLTLYKVGDIMSMAPRSVLCHALYFEAAMILVILELFFQSGAFSNKASR